MPTTGKHVKFTVPDNLFRDHIVKISEVTRRTVTNYAEMIRARMLSSMREPKHGNVYWHARDQRWHIASAPGEAPAIWNGPLSQSLQVRFSNGGWMATIGSFGEIPYAARHENGPPRRPFAQPALDQYADEFVGTLRSRLANL